MTEDFSMSSPLAGRRRSRSDAPITPEQMQGDGNDDQILPSLRLRLKTLASEFQARTSVLQRDPANQLEMDMRFLGVMFSFNDF